MVGHDLVGEGEPLKGCKQGSALIKSAFEQDDSGRRRMVASGL